MEKESFLEADLDNQVVVDKIFCYDRKFPIRAKETMIPGKTVRWTEPDAQWQQWIDHQRWGKKSERHRIPF